MLSDSSKKLPKILTAQVVAKSRLFEIQSVDLEFSNGELRTYERFKPGNQQAVMMVPIDGDDLLLIREYSVGTERYELGFPKGGVEKDEEPKDGSKSRIKGRVGAGGQ